MPMKTLLQAFQGLHTALRRATDPASRDWWGPLHNATVEALVALDDARSTLATALPHSVFKSLGGLLAELDDGGYAEPNCAPRDVRPPRAWARRAGELVGELGGEPDQAGDFAEVLFELGGGRTKALFRHLWDHPETTRREVEEAVYGGAVVEPASVDKLVDRLGEKLLELKGWTTERSGESYKLHCRTK